MPQGDPVAGEDVGDCDGRDLVAADPNDDEVERSPLRTIVVAESGFHLSGVLVVLVEWAT